MDKIVIEGGRPLDGRIEVSAAKNAALPVMAAALLTAEPLDLENVPDLADISSMRRLLQLLGVNVTHKAGEPGHMVLHCPELLSTTAPYDLVRKMRASVLALGPLVARAGEAWVSLPGGCAIGTRPIDIHLAGLEAMGATIELDAGYVHAATPGGLKGTEYLMPQVSVGATENLMMAATLARGTTVLHNCAREPEIVDLAACLNAMGARIAGAGTAHVTIEGVDALHAASHRVIPDRIETGTYVMAAGITGGRIEIRGADPKLFGDALEKLRATGLVIEATEAGLVVDGRERRLDGVDVMTQPFPGFATDLQAQFMALMCVADGAAMITETIFENRFMHVPELLRMGARVNVQGASALVRGVERLKGAPVMATDLRASVSLVLAGLAAEGTTEVNRVYHLDRGYAGLESKLRACGARLERVA
ncbi:MAG: UDP-N-acetylglucosamine 1-carboxyvinyltransferase [Alphaproteobacteria bacterium]